MASVEDLIRSVGADNVDEASVIALQERGEVIAHSLGVGDAEVASALDELRQQFKHCQNSVAWEEDGDATADSPESMEQNAFWATMCDGDTSVTPLKRLLVVLASALQRDENAAHGDEEHTDAEVSALRASALASTRTFFTLLCIPGSFAFGAFNATVFSSALRLMQRASSKVAELRCTARSGNGAKRTRATSDAEAAGSDADEMTDTDAGAESQQAENASMATSLTCCVDAMTDVIGVSPQHARAVAEIIPSLLVGVEFDAIERCTVALFQHQRVAPDAVAKPLLQRLLPVLRGDVVAGSQDDAAALARRLMVSMLALQLPAAPARVVATDSLALEAAPALAAPSGGAPDDRSLALKKCIEAAVQRLCLKPAALQARSKRQRACAAIVEVMQASCFPLAQRLSVLRFLQKVSRTKHTDTRLFTVEVCAELLSSVLSDAQAATGNIAEASKGETPKVDNGGFALPMPRAPDSSSNPSPSRVAHLQLSVTLMLLWARRKDTNPAVRAKALRALAALGPEKLVADVLHPCDVLDELRNLLPAKPWNASSFVRKATVELIGAQVQLLMHADCRATQESPSSFEFDMKTVTDDIDLLRLHCADPAVTVKKQAACVLQELLFAAETAADSSEEAEAGSRWLSILRLAWVQGVLPQTSDDEAAVRSKAAELLETAVLHRISGDIEDAEAKHAWLLAGSLRQLPPALTVALQRCFMDWSRSGSVTGPTMTRLVKALLRSARASLGLTEAKPADGAIERADIDNFNSAIADSTLTHVRWAAWAMAEALAKQISDASSKQETLSPAVKKAFDAATKAMRNSSVALAQCWKLVSTMHTRLGLGKLGTGDGSRMLSVLSVVVSLAPDSAGTMTQDLCNTMMEKLDEFMMPASLVQATLRCLSALCDGAADGSSTTAKWCAALLAKCESGLRQYLQKDANGICSPPAQEKVTRHLHTLGEVSLIGFDPTAEENSAGSGSRTARTKRNGTAVIPASLTQIVRLFLVERLPAAPGRDKEIDMPSAVRAHAFAALGKLCLRDKQLAKDNVTVFVRALSEAREPAVRSNILLVLGDMCVRHTSLVDRYVPEMARRLRDNNATVRRHALSLLARLLLQDFIRWGGMGDVGADDDGSKVSASSLFFGFIAALGDPEPALRSLASHLLGGPLLCRFPALYHKNFVQCFFAFNGLNVVNGSVVAGEVATTGAADDDGAASLELAADMAKEPSRRHAAYAHMLQRLTEQQRIEVAARLVVDVLPMLVQAQGFASVAGATINEAGIGSPVGRQRTGERAVMAFKDVLHVLSLPQMQHSTGKNDGAAALNEAEQDLADASAASGSAQALAIASAQRRLLGTLWRKKMVEDVVPTLLKLKLELAQLRSPLLSPLLTHMLATYRMYKDEVRTVMANDPTSLRELEYDLKQVEAAEQQLAERKQAAEQARAEQAAAPVAAGADATPRAGKMCMATPGSSQLPTKTPVSSRASALRRSSSKKSIIATPATANALARRLSGGSAAGASPGSAFKSGTPRLRATPALSHACTPRAAVQAAVRGEVTEPSELAAPTTATSSTLARVAMARAASEGSGTPVARASASAGSSSALKRVKAHGSPTARADVVISSPFQAEAPGSAQRQWNVEVDVQEQAVDASDDEAEDQENAGRSNKPASQPGKTAQKADADAAPDADAEAEAEPQRRSSRRSKRKTTMEPAPAAPVAVSKRTRRSRRVG